MATLEFKMQDAEAKKIMENLIQGLSDFTPALKDTSKYEMKQIDEAFKVAGKNITGEPWAKLSPDYLKAKMKAGFLTNILVRTGKMRESFKQIALTKNNLKITNVGTDYFKYHQVGTSKMPQRQMLGYSQAMITQIMKIVGDYILSLLKK